MPVITPVISRRGYLKLAKESVWGTPVAATVSLPTASRELVGVAERVSPDIALNQRVRDFLAVKGRQHAAGPIAGPAFGTSFGHILMGTLGVDTVTNPLPVPTGLATAPATTGGTLATGTYGYRVSAVTAAGETTAATEVTAAVTGPTGSVTVSWNEVPGALAYNVYGRTVAGELKMLPAAAAGTTTAYTVPAGVLSFVDTGSITPAGALPASNTAGTQHLFTPATVLPSYTIEQNFGGLSLSEQFPGCIFGSTTLRAQFEQNAGLLEFTANILGMFPTQPPIPATAFAAPTDKPAVAAKAFAAWGSLSWAKLMEFSVTVNNVPEPIKVASGVLDLQNGIATDLEVGGSARIVFDNFQGNAINEYTDWQGNTQRKLQFAFPFESNETFTLIIPTAYIFNWKKNHRGRFVDATFDWKAVLGTNTSIVQAALSNSQVAGY